MRNRTIGINVRVCENEKKKLQRNAKKSNLNELFPKKWTVN